VLTAFLGRRAARQLVRHVALRPVVPARGYNRLSAGKPDQRVQLRMHVHY